MSMDAIKLLSRLAGASTPGAGASVGASVGAGGAGQSGDAFAALLGQARAGQIETEQVVSVGRAVGLSLSPEQQQRLGGAVDKAQAAGLSRALVLMDGMALVVDVQNRSVQEQLSNQSGVLDGVDGVVSVPPVTWSSAAGGGTGADASVLHASADELLSRLVPGARNVGGLALGG